MTSDRTMVNLTVEMILSLAHTSGTTSRLALPGPTLGLWRSYLCIQACSHLLIVVNSL